MRTVHTKNDVRGFTLAELLVVVAIIAVLVAVSIPIFSAKLEKAREATDIANMRSAKACAVTYILEDNMDSQVYNTNTNKTGVFKNATSNDGKTQFYIADFDAVKGVLVRPTNSMTGYGQGTIKDGGSKAYLGYTGATVAKDKHIRVWINKTTSEITISWE